MKNVLDCNFTPSEPSKIWVSDITYIHTREGLLYLTTVLDLYDRKCIGWSINDAMKTEETSLAAWNMAIKNRKLSTGLIFHSDRGTQYSCEKFSNTLDSYKIVTRNMTRKGNCWDKVKRNPYQTNCKAKPVSDPLHAFRYSCTMLYYLLGI